MVAVRIKTAEGVFAPVYTTSMSSGFEIRAKSFLKLFKGNKEVPLNRKLQKSIEEGYLTLRGFERVLIGTGIEVKLEGGFEIQIRDLPGNALKKGLLVANSPGTIDGKHRGEIGVILINNTPFLNKITLGDRIAQGVLTTVHQAAWIQDEDLPGELTRVKGYEST